MLSEKINKYKINDPILQFFAGKYESEIPWQTIVSDEISLSNFIKNSLYLQFLNTLKLPSVSSKNVYYVEEKHVNVGELLKSRLPTDLDLTMVEELYECGFEKEATLTIVDQINNNKKKFFKEWVEVLNKNFPNQYAFWLIVMRAMFKTAGKGKRRPINEPSLDILKWLYSVIEMRMIFHTYQIAREYHAKSIFGLQERVDNGWVHIPSGLNQIKKLTSLVVGSGWCIAGGFFARYYLSYCTFDILLISGRPEVAIRKATDGSEYECQGRYNYEPSDWGSEIEIFSNIPDPEYSEIIAEKYKNHSVEWWVHNISIWPNLLFSAPEHIQFYFRETEKERNSIISAAMRGLSFEHFTQFVDRWKIVLSFSDYMNMMLFNPNAIEIINHGDFSDQEYQELFDFAVVRTLERIKRKGVTVQDLASISSKIKSDKRFQEIEKSFASNFLTKRAKSRAERRIIETLDTSLPPTPTDSAQLTRLRITNAILSVTDHSCFNDEIFHEVIKTRPDFAELRAKGWIEAVRERPTTRLALPSDLEEKISQEFDFSTSDMPLVKKWLPQIIKSPWKLDAKSTVPKSIRYTDVMLGAYIVGWGKIWREDFWKMWKKPSSRYPQRKYMEYAAFRNFEIIEQIASSIRNSGSYMWPSERMFGIPAYQLAILMAFKNTPVVFKAAMIELTEYTSDPLVQYVEQVKNNQINTFIEACRKPDGYLFMGLTSFKHALEEVEQLSGHKLEPVDIAKL